MMPVTFGTLADLVTGGSWRPDFISERWRQAEVPEQQYNSRLAGLDLLRAMAILGVLALHSLDCSRGVPALIARPSAFGWAGVDLFFVLSGYLIAGQLFRSDATSTGAALKMFWRRRWFRTLPLYFVVLLVYVVVKPLLGYPFLSWSWTYLVFLQNYTSIRDFGQSWSLCIEEQFYLVFPIFVLVLGIRARPAFVWLLPICVSVVFRTLYAGEVTSILEAHSLIMFRTYTHLDGLSMGVFLAATASIWKGWRAALRRGLAALGLVALLGYLSTFRDPILAGTDHRFGYTIIAAAFSAMLVGVVNLELPSLVRRPIEQVAIWSYGAYLWNNLLARELDHLSLNWIVAIPLFFAGSLAMGACTYYLVERPFLSFRDRVLRTHNKHGFAHNNHDSTTVKEPQPGSVSPWRL
jgi:peptidoglycan/LPS O-acetylase OafA/YrhL